jgi:glucan phosphoethanolaminetransferase (alkaline phosphatase superfamily)
LFFILGGVLLTPLLEEFVFRGLTLHAYAEVRSQIFVVLFTSLLFSLLHGTPGHAIVVFPMGFVTALLTFKTKQLWPAILIHMLNNALALTIPSSDSSLTIQPLIGIGGLAVTLICLVSTWYWLRPSSDRFQKPISIWTPSLVIVVIICILSIFISALNAYFPKII